MSDSAVCFFRSPVFEEEAKNKFLTLKNLPLVTALYKHLQGVDAFDHDQLESVFKTIMKQFEVKMAKVAQPLRVILTGKTVSPGIYDVLELVGKNETLNRLKYAIDLINQESKT